MVEIRLRKRPIVMGNVYKIEDGLAVVRSARPDEHGFHPCILFGGIIGETDYPNIRYFTSEQIQEAPFLGHASQMRFSVEQLP